MDESILYARLGLSPHELATFCQRWQVKELCLFGSVLSQTFSANSDIDILVTFREDAPWRIFDFVRMRNELQTLVGREIDLIEKVAIERSRNPIRRRAILESARRLYAA